MQITHVLSPRIPLTHLQAVMIATLLFVVLFGVVYVAFVSSDAVVCLDWCRTYRAGALELLRGENPYYDGGIFYSPPWSAIALAPLAILPPDIGHSLVVSLGFVGYAALARRFGADPIALALFVSSPPVLHGLLNSNVEWLVMAGIFLPHRLGLFVLMIKPQVGVGIALYWMYKAWCGSGIHGVWQMCWPVGLATFASLALYGLWPLHAQDTSQYWFNASLFPYSLPVAAALLYFAAKRRSEGFALAATPFLAPYALFHSYAAALAPLAQRRAWIFAGWLAMWGIVALHVI